MDEGFLPPTYPTVLFLSFEPIGIKDWGGEGAATPHFQLNSLSLNVHIPPPPNQQQPPQYPNNPPPRNLLMLAVHLGGGEGGATSKFRWTSSREE